MNNNNNNNRNKYILFILIIICILIHESYEWRIFNKGRQLGGNMGTLNNINKDLPKEQWFIQTLNHFNPTDNRTWNQRYYTNEEFYNASKNVNTPVFISIGGEGEVNATWMVEGAWIDYAKQYHALCFQLEHRYYGKSRPTIDMSTKNLQYLSSEQALHDLAHFIESMNIKYGLITPKWIAFGGSYPGSLAAWLRYKYPHLVVGAMSASGPVLAKLDFYEYFGVVEQSLRTTASGDECVAAIIAGTKQLDVLLKHPLGQQSIDKKFKLCDSIQQSVKNPLDVSNFYETLSGNFAGVVQYNKDNRVSAKFPRASNITMDTLCSLMVNDSLGVELNRLAAVNDLILDVYEQKCLDYKYENMVTTLRNVSWKSEASEGGRQWMYQTCTEFGFYQTSTNKPQLFGDEFPVEFFIQQCMDIFGVKFNERFISNRIVDSNIEYGGLDVGDEVSNVVFVHGSVDPWHALGITSTKNNQAPAIFIKGTAHCANMYPASPNDLPQLKAARLQISQLIDTWLRLP